MVDDTNPDDEIQEALRRELSSFTTPVPEDMAGRAIVRGRRRRRAVASGVVLPVVVLLLATTGVVVGRAQDASAPLPPLASPVLGFSPTPAPSQMPTQTHSSAPVPTHSDTPTHSPVVSPHDPTPTTSPTPSATAAAFTDVNIYNGTTKVGLDASWAKKLKAKGWKVTSDASWASQSIKTTVVYYPPGQKAAAQKLATDVGNATVAPATSSAESALALTLVLGTSSA